MTREPGLPLEGGPLLLANRLCREDLERTRAERDALRELLAEVLGAVWESEWTELRPRIRAALGVEGPAG